MLRTYPSSISSRCCNSLLGNCLCKMVLCWSRCAFLREGVIQSTLPVFSAFHSTPQHSSFLIHTHQLFVFTSASSKLILLHDATLSSQEQACHSYIDRCGPLREDDCACPRDDASVWTQLVARRSVYNQVLLQYPCLCRPDHSCHPQYEYLAALEPLHDRCRDCPGSRYV